MIIGLRALTLTAAASVTALFGAVAPASAGDYSGDFMIKAGISGVLPNTEFNGITLNGAPFIPGDIAEVDDSWVPSLTLTYFVTKNIGVELFCCFAQHGIEGKGPLNGVELGETKIFPPILSLQYHFDGIKGIKGIKSYVGAGVQYIHPSMKIPKPSAPALISTPHGASACRVVSTSSLAAVGMLGQTFATLGSIPKQPSASVRVPS